MKNKSTRLIDRIFSVVCKLFDIIDPQVRREKKVMRERPECFEVIEFDFNKQITKYKIKKRILDVLYDNN